MQGLLGGWHVFDVTIPAAKIIWPTYSSQATDTNLGLVIIPDCPLIRAAAAAWQTSTATCIAEDIVKLKCLLMGCRWACGLSLEANLRRHVSCLLRWDCWKLGERLRSGSEGCSYVWLKMMSCWVCMMFVSFRPVWGPEHLLQRLRFHRVTGMQKSLTKRILV